MTPERDVVSTPQSQAYPQRTRAPQEADAAIVTPFQEINERRARVERPDLLRQLRGL